MKLNEFRKRIIKIVAFLVVFSLLIVFIKNLEDFTLFGNSKAVAISVEESLNKIEEDNPVENEINKRIKEEEIRQEKLRLEKQRAEEKKKRESNKKIAYLTFDDGPSKKSTPMILDVLKKHGIKATFFVVGTQVKENPSILKRTYEEGHKIGNHSYSHNYSYIYGSVGNFMEDFYKAEELIKSVVGEEFDSKVMRFPGGSFEAKKDPMKQAINNKGYTYVDWNALNGDAEGASFSEPHLINRLAETVGNKKKVVILMHDTDGKITTAKSLDQSIRLLIDKGYSFEVLDKNFSWEQ